MNRHKIGNLEQLLVNFDLTLKQAKIYLIALQLGPATVQEIAKKAGTERTNAYDAVGGLIAKGLMSVSTEGKKKFFVAESPERLKLILSQKEEALKSMLPELQILRRETEYKPRVLYYPGLEGYKQVYEDTLTSKEKKLFGIYSIQDMWEVVGRDYTDRMVRRRVKEEIFLQVVRSQEKDVGLVYPTSQEDLREMRHAPPGMVFAITTYVYDNKVAILSSKKEMFGLLIESEDIAQVHRNYFKVLWDASTPT